MRRYLFPPEKPWEGAPTLGVLVFLNVVLLRRDLPEQLRRDLRVSLEQLLLTGRINDREYFAAIAAGGLSRPGWSSRPARIRRAVLEVLSLIAVLVVLGFTVWAMSIPMPR